MLKWANRLFFCLNALSLVAGIYFFGKHKLLAAPDGIEYKDLITIILTAIAVLLAAVTIFVALMAIWGYNSIRDEAMKAARQTATDVARVVAARETVTMSGVVQGAGESDSGNELAAALRDGNSARAEPERGPREVR